MNVIDYFDAPPYEWLSNFYPHEVHYQGYLWATNEHAFQAAKTLDERHRRRIRDAAEPGAAKWLGQKKQFEEFRVELRADWETVKYDVMLALCRVKFSDPDLCRKLLATGDAHLVEGNTWNDTCWGVCGGVGANNLGRTLMLVRAEKRCKQLYEENQGLLKALRHTPKALY